MWCLDLGFWIAVGNICHSHIVGVEDYNIWSVFSSTENGKTKELFLELPPESLNQVGWDEGDTLLWEELDHGAWSVTKKEDAINDEN